MTDSSNSEQSRDGNISKIAGYIEDIDFTMFTTVDENGGLESRPMSTQKIEFDGDVYFFAYDDSTKIKHIKNNSNVNLAYSQPEKQNYLSLKGKAAVLKDRQKMEELWSPELKAWFPEELNTPGITLIKVEVESAEYWDSPSSTVAHLIGLVKATVTGKVEQTGDNVTVELNQ